ncbi:MAG: amidohydrolase family protein [Anaerolineae bacterium]
MVVDAHVHVYPPEFVAGRERLAGIDSYFGTLYASPKARMAAVEELIASMDASGIDHAVLAAFGWSDSGLCREHNAYTIECVRRYPDRLIGLAVANPAHATAARDLTLALEAGLAGIGELMPDAGHYSLDTPEVADALGDVAAHFAVPLLVHASEPVGHLYPGKGTVLPAQVIGFAQRHPAVKLVCAHWGGGLPFYELMPEVGRVLANTYYDTAAWPLLYDDRIFAAAERLVPGKVLFATDYPLIGQAKALMRVRQSGLDEAQLAAVLADTARRIYQGRQ